MYIWRKGLKLIFTGFCCCCCFFHVNLETESHILLISISDTIKEAESPSIIRRFSTMLHSSFRSSRLSTHRSSDCSSQNSLHTLRSTSVSSPSHTLLRRATSKTAKGSSIIHKDGTIIITKNGKIISVRRDIDSIKRDTSFGGFEDLKTRHNGVSKSLTEINAVDNVELSPLLQVTKKRSSPGHSPHSSSENFYKNFGHTSLTKIDSVDETETECKDNKLRPPESHSSRNSQSLLFPGEDTSPGILSQENKSNSPSVKSDLDEVFIQSPVIITFGSQEGMLNSMPMTPVCKEAKKIAKSDMQLDIESKEKSGKEMKNMSKSSHNVQKIPVVRYPSVERLDVQSFIPRCSSDASTIRKLLPKSPLYVRRWLSNKTVGNDQKSKT